MGNLRTVTEHMLKRLERSPLSGGRRWEVPRMLLTRDGQDHWISSEGSFWRALSFIEAAQTFELIKDMEQAHEVGRALGMFHNLLSDLPAAKLADMLGGFHVTPRCLESYDEVLAKKGAAKSREVDHALHIVEARRPLAPVLEEAKAQGRLRLRPIHGDPKINNFMMDNATVQAVILVDLDTVKPGLAH